MLDAILARNSVKLSRDEQLGRSWWDACLAHRFLRSCKKMKRIRRTCSDSNKSNQHEDLKGGHFVTIAHFDVRFSTQPVPALNLAFLGALALLV